MHPLFFLQSPGLGEEMVGRVVQVLAERIKIGGRFVLIFIIIVGGQTQFPRFHREEKTRVIGLLHASLQRGGCRIAVDRPLHRDDVDDAADAFSVVAGSGIGNDLYVLDVGGRHAFQYGGRIVAQQARRSAVQVDLKIAAALKLDIIIAIDRNHRDFAQHIERIADLGFGILLKAVGEFVDLRLDKRLLGGDRYLVQHFRIVCHIQLSGVPCHGALG